MADPTAGLSRHALRLGADHVGAVTAALCEAFADYPVMRYVLDPGRGNYDGRLTTLVRLFVTARVLRNEPMLGIVDGPVLAAAALVSVPGAEMPAPLARLRDDTWEEIGMESRSRYDDFVAAAAPFVVEAPHLHLNMIGVRSAYRGKGLARILLESVHDLSRTTPDCAGVSLTTEDARNLPLYERFGYRVIGHAHVGPGLETWGMYRSGGTNVHYP